MVFMIFIEKWRFCWERSGLPGWRDCGCGLLNWHCCGYGLLSCCHGWERTSMSVWCCHGRGWEHGWCGALDRDCRKWCSLCADCQLQSSLKRIRQRSCGLETPLWIMLQCFAYHSLYTRRHIRAEFLQGEERLLYLWFYCSFLRYISPWNPATQRLKNDHAKRVDI